MTHSSLSSDSLRPEQRHGWRRPALAIAAMALTLGLGAAAVQAENLNRIVLRVNDQILTLHEYESRKSGELTRILRDQSLGANERQQALETVGQEVMQSVFGELLLLSFAEQHGIRIRDAEVEEALLEMQQRQGVSTREELEQALQAFGFTYEQWKESTRREMVWSQVVGREVNAKIEVGEEELRAYYRNNQSLFEVPERRHLEEILVLDSSGLDAATLEARAGEIAAELGAGADLAEVAEKYKESGLTSGVIELGWLERTEIDRTLADPAWELSKGQTSPPIIGRGGYHILRLVDLEEATTRPFDEVEELILRRERSRRFQKELRDFLAKLENQAHIVENLPAEAVGYRNLAPDLGEEDALGSFFSAPLEEVQEDLGGGESAADEGAAGDA